MSTCFKSSLVNWQPLKTATASYLDLDLPCSSNRLSINLIRLMSLNRRLVTSSKCGIRIPSYTSLILKFDNTRTFRCTSLSTSQSWGYLDLP